MAADNPVPVPPFWGSRVVKGLAQNDFAAYLDEQLAPDDGADDELTARLAAANFPNCTHANST